MDFSLMQLILLIALLLDPKPFDFSSEEKVEQVVGARVDYQQMASNLETQVSRLEKQLAERDAQNAAMHEHIVELEKQPLLEIGNLARIPVQTRPVQIIVTTSEHCAPCHALIVQLIKRLDKFEISDDPNAQICIKAITDDEWRKRGIKLPLVELRVRDDIKLISERDPIKLANIYNQAIELEKTLEPIPGSQVTGMSVATIQGKEQVMQMLQLLEPFLDGGTLQVIYTAKPGVVKNFLTIKRGSFGIKIPSKTSFTLQMHNGDLSITLQDPKPQLILGPLERGIQEIDITPNKVSLRLPWMIDPELQFK